MMMIKVYRRLLERLQEHERRIAGMGWNGRVSEVDAAKGLIRVKIGKDADGADVLSPWMPVSQHAGALKIKSLPSVGQTVSIRSNDGDIEQAVATPHNWNKDNASPSQGEDDHVLTLGDVTISLTAGGISMSIGGTTFNFTADGFAQDGGQVIHDSKNIGSTHLHTGVVPGGALTGVPS